MRRLLLLPAAALSACQSEPAIEVSNAVVAATPSSAAIYATIANDGGSDDQLTGIEIDGHVPIGLHQTSNEAGIARMRPVDSLEVPAGKTLELKSGGAHGMAMGRIEASPPSVPLTFRFARSAPIRVSATLAGPGGTARP